MSVAAVKVKPLDVQPVARRRATTRRKQGPFSARRVRKVQCLRCWQAHRPERLEQRKHATEVSRLVAQQLARAARGEPLLQPFTLPAIPGVRGVIGRLVLEFVAWAWRIHGQSALFGSFEAIASLIRATAGVACSAKAVEAQIARLPYLVGGRLVPPTEGEPAPGLLCVTAHFDEVPGEQKHNQVANAYTPGPALLRILAEIDERRERAWHARWSGPPPAPPSPAAPSDTDPRLLGSVGERSSTNSDLSAGISLCASTADPKNALRACAREGVADERPMPGPSVGGGDVDPAAGGRLTPTREGVADERRTPSTSVGGGDVDPAADGRLTATAAPDLPPAPMATAALEGLEGGGGDGPRQRRAGGAVAPRRSPIADRRGPHPRPRGAAHLGPPPERSDLNAYPGHSVVRRLELDRLRTLVPEEESAPPSASFVAECLAAMRRLVGTGE